MVGVAYHRNPYLHGMAQWLPQKPEQTSQFFFSLPLVGEGGGRGGI